MLYFDYNATAPLHPIVYEQILNALQHANPSSIHTAGRAARAVVEAARRTIAEYINCKPVQIIFTSGATEANALALQGLNTPAYAYSAVEHDAVRNVRTGFILPVDHNGVLNLTALHNFIQANPGALIAVQYANNETGVIQPIAEIAKIVHAQNGLLHVDAAQAVGRLPIDFMALGADSMALTAHKTGGSKGIGALIIREALPLIPLLKGGGQEQRRRGGTENVPGIAGFGALMPLLPTMLAQQPQLAQWRDQLAATIKTANPQAEIFGTAALRLSNTLQYALPNQNAVTRLMQFDLAGFAVSSGSACSSGKVTPSHVLKAMGVDDNLAKGAIRISMGWATTEADVQKLAHYLQTT